MPSSVSAPRDTPFYYQDAALRLTQGDAARPAATAARPIPTGPRASAQRGMTRRTATGTVREHAYNTSGRTTAAAKPDSTRKPLTCWPGFRVPGPPGIPQSEIVGLDAPGTEPP